MTEQELVHALEQANGIERVDLLLKLFDFLPSKDRHRAESLCREALELSQTHHYARGEIRSHFAIANVHYSVGEFDEWKHAIDESHQIYMEGAIEVALERYLALNERLEEVNLDSPQWFRSYVHVKAYLGLSWLKANNPVAALESFYAAEDLTRQQDPDGVKPYLKWPRAMVGRAYMELREYEKAREWFRRDIHGDKQDEFPDWAGTAYLLIAESYIDEGIWENVLESLADAARVYERHQHTNQLHWLYWHQFSAIALRHLDRLNEAQDKIHHALTLHNEIGLISSEEIYLEMGLLSFAQGNSARALSHLGTALDSVHESGNKKILAKVHEALYQVHDSLGNFDKALQHSDTAQEYEREEWKSSRAMTVAAIERDHTFAQELKNAEIHRLRNVELARRNEELAELNDQKNRLMEERRGLMRMAVHDLRNPLSVIVLRAQRLIKLTESEAEVDNKLASLESIEKAADNMGELIDRLLSSDRLEAGDFEIITKEIDVYNVAAEVVDQLGESANAKSIKVMNHIRPKEILLTTDPIFLQQILVNMLSNAIKYSPAETEVTIKGNLSELAAHIEVEDQGQGLTEADKENVFKKYRRLSAAPTAGETSTGLGLYVAQRLANALDGQITVRSRGKNQGATFTVSLPHTKYHQK